MKILFIVIIGFLFIRIANAQTDSASTAFIRSVLPRKAITYCDKLDKHTVQEIKKELDQDTIYNDVVFNLNKTHASMLALNKDERKYIIEAVTNLTGHTWDRNLLKNASLVERDTIQQLLDKKGGWDTFHKNSAPGFYEFSKPIFIRNNAMCIFYIAYRCGGLCGNGNLAIYIKRNGIWVKEYVLYTWMS
jgi:hypothetical protein